MFGLENKLFDQLVKLKNEYGLDGIKAEFETEGSSFRDLVRLRRITGKAGVRLFLKIGGVEAVRDIRDSLEVGVDGLIAPMVESKFGLQKFIQAYDSVYGDLKIHRSINIETVCGLNHIDDILGLAEGTIDNIAIGRTDLSRSYFDKNICPDSDVLFQALEAIGKKVNGGMTMTVGGGLTAKSVRIFKKDKDLWSKLIYRLETRKVIMPVEQMLGSEHCLQEALKFEELYILSKQEISDLFLETEISRLTQLKMRY